MVAIIKPAIVWNAPVFDPSGYADEARNFLLALERSGEVELKLRAIRWSNLTTELRPDVFRKLRSLTENQIESNYANVLHIFPTYYQRDPQAAFNIGRTMYETDRIPLNWVEACNRMDEIWVPTEFNLETFARSGVREEKLFKVPGCFDVDKYASPVEPLSIEGSATFNFLSPFDWCLRKGWDVLLRAYCREFREDEDVALILKVYSTLGYTHDQIHQLVHAYVTNTLGMDVRKAPRIIFLNRILSDWDMPRLYRASQALVMPSRCEGWGRPFMEAMAMGLPVIGTGWSGNTEFMNTSNSFLIDCRVVDVPEEASREIPTFRGHRWAEPSEEHLRQLMRQIFQDRAAADEKGIEARDHVIRNYNWDRVAQIIVNRVNELRDGNGGVRCGKTSGKHRVVWEGEQFTSLSLAVVNRNLCYHLDRGGGCELSLVSDEKLETRHSPFAFSRFKTLANRLNAPLTGPADFHIRHRWPPVFTPPDSGHWIIIQPWEFGALPQEWVPHMEDMVDELWVPSSYVKRCYIESGVSEEKVVVVPNGVDMENFTVRAKALKLNTDKRFRFLYVGGLFHRKGIDVLLKAYNSAFSKRDDVCLVIKDLGPSYGDGSRLTIDRSISESQAARGAPEILRISEKLSDEQMAGLYRACHSLVHPYRGEGFGLPVAEAMACGLPVIVTKGGACDDFCSEETVYYVPAVRSEIELGQKAAGQPWLLEPDVEALAEQMKHVVSNYSEALERAKAAGGRIRSALTWEKSAEIAMGRLNALRSRPIRRFSASQLKFKRATDERPGSDGNDKSLEDLFMLMERHPEDPALHNRLGEALVQAGRHDEARLEFEKALELDPGCLEAYNDLGALYWATGKTDEALEKFQSVLKRDENNLDALVNCGIACAQSGRKEQAVTLLRKYLSLAGEDLEVRLTLSEVLRSAGRKEEALEELGAMLETDPANEGARLLVSEISGLT